MPRKSAASAPDSAWKQSVSRSATETRPAAGSANHDRVPRTVREAAPRHLQRGARRDGVGTAASAAPTASGGCSSRFVNHPNVLGEVDAQKVEQQRRVLQADSHLHHEPTCDPPVEREEEREVGGDKVVHENRIAEDEERRRRPAAAMKSSRYRTERVGASASSYAGCACVCRSSRRGGSRRTASL